MGNRGTSELLKGCGGMIKKEKGIVVDAFLIDCFDFIPLQLTNMGLEMMM